MQNGETRPEWASEILRKLDAIWTELQERRAIAEDHEVRIRSLEATRAESDRVRRLAEGG
jgi:hypothetical protein